MSEHISSDSASGRPTRVAVIGAGPAGATTAALLARKGASVVLLDDGKRPEMVVGESLIPMLTALFQRLGLEEAVAAISVRKPGVNFAISPETVLHLSFEAVRGVLPTYAYNVPRREFDQLILQSALDAGTRYVSTQARLTEGPGQNEVRLAPETLALIPEWAGAPPDILIDASGRRRMFARLLKLPAAIGPRQDVAHFAHYQDCPMPQPPGQVEIGRLEQGWSWQIPLPGNRLSIGVVVNRDYAPRFGQTPEEQLEAIIERNPRLAAGGAGRRRVSPVASYGNYQLISEVGHGPGWAMVGDAFGFVDPMLSPGLCMAMLSAERLAGLIPARGGWNGGLAGALPGYEAWFRAQLEAWQSLVDHFYDGRIFAIHRSGADFCQRLPKAVSRLLDRHIAKHLAGMAAGALTTNPYSRGLLGFLGKHAIRGHDPKDFAIA